MRHLGFTLMVGAFVAATGCDTSSVTVPPSADGGGTSSSGSSTSSSSGGSTSSSSGGSTSSSSGGSTSSSSGSSASSSSGSGSSASSSSGSSTSSTGGSSTSSSSGSGSGSSSGGCSSSCTGSSSSSGGSSTSSGSSGSSTSSSGSSSGTKVSDAGESDAKTSDAKAPDASEVDARAPDGGGSDAGSCVLPTCLTNLEKNCTPSGQCSQYYDENSGNTYSCYPNGVKRSDIIPEGQMNTTITVENATATCYTIVYSSSDVNSQIATTAVVANGSDAGVASISLADDGVTWSVTCDSGGKAVTLDPSCSNEWPVTWLINGPPSQQICTMVSTCSM